MEHAESSSRSKISESDAVSGHYPRIGVRQFGRFNWLGLWTLYLKEVRRFTKVWMQTLMAPIVTTLLFLAIFSLALAGLRPDINGVPFINFLAPGLIMMSIVQNAETIMDGRAVGQSNRPQNGRRNPQCGYR